MGGAGGAGAAPPCNQQPSRVLKKILVLGAGMVAGAHVQYLLQQPITSRWPRALWESTEIGITRGRARALILG